MTILYAAGAIALSVAFLVWRVRKRAYAWATEIGEVGFPFAHVVARPAEPTQQSFDVTLHATPRPHPIERISIDVPDLVRIGLEAPEGFVRSGALENEIEDDRDRARVWVPTAPMALAPGEPRRFTLRFSAQASTPAIVTITLKTPMTIGGGVMPVNLQVPLRDPLAIAIANERADFRLEARRRNVMPNTLPGWSDMLEREKQIADEPGAEPSSSAPARPINAR